MQHGITCILSFLDHQPVYLKILVRDSFPQNAHFKKRNSECGAKAWNHYSRQDSYFYSIISSSLQLNYNEILYINNFSKII